jgi:Flp pilus assembly protein TadD
MKGRPRRPPARQAAEPERFVWPAAVIFFLALSLRLIHLWQIRRAPYADLLIGDARAYDLWAQQIAGGDWIGREVFYQAPLYAYFLGAVYALVGHDLAVVRALQAVLGAGACVLLAIAGWRMFSRCTGIVAGVMLAVYAPAIFFDGLIQKSVLDMWFLCLILWILATRLLDRPHDRRAWLALGLALGGLGLTRENGLVLAVVAMGWAAARGRQVTRPNLACAGTLLGGLMIVLLPVMFRNLAVGGEFHLTTSQFGPNFYIGNNPTATGWYDPLREGRGSAQYERGDATALAEQALNRRLTPAEVSGYWTGRALAFIRSDPAAWSALLATKFRLLWNATEIMDTESQEWYAEWSVPLRATGWIGHFGVLVPLALLGMVVAWSERRRVGVLLAMAGAFASTVVLFYVFARYRYPLVPFLMLFAAAGLAGLPGLARRLPRPALLATGVALVLAAIWVNQPIIAADLTRAVTASNLGRVLLAEGRHDEAIEQYRRAIAIKPDWAAGHFNLGKALHARRRSAEAVPVFQRSLQLQGDNPQVHFSLGSAFLSIGQSREAIEHFRQAQRSLPATTDLHRALGLALSRESRTAEALVEFQAALALEPNSAQAHNDVGVALAVQGDLQAAIVQFERALSLNRDFAEARSNLESARAIALQK